MSCPYALDDGAYVLGALSPTERAEFERHLASCAPCRESVAALAVLPGLLGRLDAATASPIMVTTPETLLPRTLAAIAAERRQRAARRRWLAVAAGVVAVFLAVLTGVGVHMIDTARSDVPMAQMQPVSQQLPVSGEIGLRPVPNGTEIHMTCRYGSGYDGRWTVRLMVFPAGAPASADGEQIATWSAGPGEEVSLIAITHLAPAQIGRIEVQRADHAPLLSWSAG